MEKFYEISKNIQSIIENILGKCSAYLMIAVTLFALAEIIRRYIFGVVFEWGQDAVIYMMVSSVAFYICVTQVNRNHLVMSAVLQLLNAKKFHRTVGFCKIFISFFVSLFTGSLTYTAYSTIEYSIKIGERTESLFFFMWPFYFILALGMGLMSLVSFLQLIEDIHSYIKGEHFTAEVEAATDV
jgi:TRAP-type C4-dicarboxylate transport system permease small subunit